MNQEHDPLTIQALQQRLGHTFSDQGWLTLALTHRSFSSSHNERLEFLGDSVLNLVVSQFLYEALADLPEGELSRVRANLVKQDTLHQLAVELGLTGLIRLGEGELRSGGQNRPSILADTLEALIGAVFLDAGFQVANDWVKRLFQKVELKSDMLAAAKDPKTELQEYLQSRKFKLPIYRVIGTTGAAHQQTFDVECEVPELGLILRGIGSSRRTGEQAAAAAILLMMKDGQ
ncbi:MAG: ribonuclease III [Limnohabitans sp.]|nr:ribonuclease III [Limnohabitans sp.]